MKAACNAFGRRCGRSKSIGCTKGDGSILKGETSHKMTKSVGFYGSIGPTWAHIFDILWPKGWTDRGTSPVETEFGIRCHRIPLGSDVLGLGYYWILLILRRSFLRPQIQKNYNWRNMETHQNIIIPKSNNWRHIKIQQFGSAHVSTIQSSVKRAAMLFSGASVRPWTCWSLPGAQCAELMGIGDHHGHFEWVYPISLKKYPWKLHLG